MDSKDIAGDIKPQNPTSGVQQKPPSVQAEIKKQVDESYEVLPMAKTLQDFIDQERAEIKDYHSYASTVFARNGKSKANAEDIEAEFRAREIYLTMLTRFEDRVASLTMNAERTIKESEKAKQI